MDRWRFSRIVRRFSCAVFSVLAMWLCMGSTASVTGAEPAGESEYRRTVEGSASLADMEKGQEWSYNGEYLYALTREVRDSTLPAGAKVVVFVPAFVVDTVFLPVALIFGLFG